jgi:hypothetical protein
MRAAEVTGLAGMGLALAAPRRRGIAVLSGALLMTASALTRFGIFHAGLDSADDPRHTVEPQRERLQQRVRQQRNRAR